MQAPPSLSPGTANSPRSRIPSLSTSSSSLSSTFSDVSFSSFSFSYPSPPPTSASKTHAFFASPFSTRSHSPEPVSQQAASSPDVPATPVPHSNLKSRLQRHLPPSEIASFRVTDDNSDAQTRSSFYLSPGNEPTPRPPNVTPALLVTRTVETVPTSAAESGVEPSIYVTPPPFSSPASVSSTKSDSSTSSLQTFITGQNTDTILRLLHTLGQGSFSSVWLAEDMSPLSLSLKAKRNLRELRRRTSQGGISPSLSRDGDEHRRQNAVQGTPYNVGTLADISRNASLKRLRTRVRGTKPSRGKIRLMDGTYLVDERDGEMGVVNAQSCDSSDAEDSFDNDVQDLGLGANLARVGSLSGKMTNVSPTEKRLHRRNTAKKSSGRLVAVKLTQRGAGNQREAEKERVAFVREVEILRQISHPNIAPLLSHLSTPTHYVLVFPYLPGGDLLSLVNSDIMWYKLGEDVLRRIWCELCKAVGWMHGVGLVHRDIKLENILLTTSVFCALGPESPRPTLDALPAPPTSFIRLSDFGLSRFVELLPNGEAELLMTRCGSEAYAAPELVTGGARSRPTSASVGDVERAKSIGVYDARETDAWACGVVLYALVSRRLPFGEGVANEDVIGTDQGRITGENGRRTYDKTERRQWLMRIAKGEYSWPESENDETLTKELTGPRLTMSRGARRIVGRLLIRDPGKRARIADLWSDPWMKGTGVDKDFAFAMTSANAADDFVDELGSLEIQQDIIGSNDTENLNEEKCWLEDEEIEKLEKEEEQGGAWLVDGHRTHSITRQELV